MRPQKHALTKVSGQIRHTYTGLIPGPDRVPDPVPIRFPFPAYFALLPFLLPSLSLQIPKIPLPPSLGLL